MKKILGAVLVAVLSLTACGGNDEPTPRETVFVERGERAPDTEPQSSVEQEYLYDINLYSNPELDAQTDADLIDLGRIVCDAFDGGASLAEVVQVGRANGEGLSQESLITIAAAAVVNFCPEHGESAGIGT